MQLGLERCIQIAKRRDGLVSLCLSQVEIVENYLDGGSILDQKIDVGVLGAGFGFTREACSELPGYVVSIR